MPQVIRDIMSNELLQWARQIPRVELSICAGLLKHEKSSVIDLIDTKALTQNWKTLVLFWCGGGTPTQVYRQKSIRNMLTESLKLSRATMKP